VRKILATLLFVTAFSCLGQELEPRSYTNLPVGQNFLGIGYAYSDGELNVAPGVPLEDAKLTLKGTVAGYVRSLDLWGKSGKVDVLWGRACIDGEAIFQGRPARADRCGTVDPALRLTYLFYGAPALSLGEFMKSQTNRVIGASLKVSAPLGDYNNENLINSGSNRWMFKPEIGISNSWGKWSAEASLAGSFYTDNEKFFGDSTLAQDPLYQVQLHVIYQLKRGRWISLNGNYFWGGRTEQDGVRKDDEQRNSRLGVTFALPLSAQHSLKFFANRGVITRIGNESDTFGLLWQYRWGD
jgi:hypothetical protein